MLDLAQRGRLECSPIFGVMGDHVSSLIGLRLVRPYTEVGIAVTSEIDTFVAFVAFGFVEENIHAMNLLRCHRILVAGLVAVIRSISGLNGALESRDGFGHPVDGDVLAAKYPREQYPIAVHRIKR